MKKSEQTKLKISSAACELFCEKGYSATSTSEIAKRAEVSEGTIFRYFATKKDLLLYIATYGIEMFAEDIAIKPLVDLSEKYKDESIEKFLYELVMDRYKLMEEHKSISMIFMNELSFHNEIQELFRKEIGEKVNDILTKSFDNFFKRGVFRDDINTRSAMRYFSGMIFVIFMEHVHGMRDENVSIEEDVKIAIDIFLNGVRNRN